METPEKDNLKWARTNAIRVESSLKHGIRREAELFFNGMVKKLMSDKDPRNTEYSYKYPV